MIDHDQVQQVDQGTVSVTLDMDDLFLRNGRFNMFVSTRQLAIFEHSGVTTRKPVLK